MTQANANPDNVYLSLSFPSIPRATADAVRAAAEQAAGDVDVNVSYGQAISYDEGWLNEDQAPVPADQPTPEVPASAPVLENNGGSTADPSSTAVDAAPTDAGTPTGTDTPVSSDPAATTAAPAPDAASAAPVEAAPATTDTTTAAPSPYADPTA